MRKLMLTPRLGRSITVSLVAGAALAGQLLSAGNAVAATPRIQFVQKASATDSTELKTVEAVCPSGTVAYGGGGDIVGGEHQVFLQQLGTFGHADRYFAQAHEDSDGYSGNWTLYAWAACGPELPGMEVVEADSAGDSSSHHTVTAVCPIGKKVLSAGGSAIGYVSPVDAWGHYILNSVVPSDSLTSVTVDGYEDQAHTSYAWETRAFALCAQPRPTMKRIATVTASSTGDKTATAECPSGLVPYGVGGGITGAQGQAHLDRLVQHTQTRFTGGDLDARSDQDGTTAPWSASVYLICGS